MTMQTPPRVVTPDPPVITAAAYRAWLEELPPTLHVGMAREPSGCPLALYAHELWTGGAEGTVVWVMGHPARIAFAQLGERGYQATYIVDPVLDRFVQLIDRFALYMGGNSLITAHRALTLLERAERKER